MAKEAEWKLRDHGFTEKQERDLQKADMVNIVKCYRALIQTFKCPLELAVRIGHLSESHFSGAKSQDCSSQGVNDR